MGNRLRTQKDEIIITFDSWNPPPKAKYYSSMGSPQLFPKKNIPQHIAK